MYSKNRDSSTPTTTNYANSSFQSAQNGHSNGVTQYERRNNRNENEQSTSSSAVKEEQQDDEEDNLPLSKFKIK